MNARVEQRFEHWRRTGDTRALADVFDELAPRLLRLAIHLVGDVATAEDLVQSTFVAAIESASSWNAERGLEPWLTGILDHRAMDVLRVRRARIETDADELVDASTPLSLAIDREHARELVKALDQLEEPLRSPMLLSVLHGMKPAAIAHVLDRSPGAVRVQLHRGRDALKKLLPAGLVASGVALVGGRGLASVKGSVLSHAALVHPAVATTALGVGGVLAMKKLFAVLAALLVIAVLLVWRGGLRFEGDRRATETTSAIATLETAPNRTQLESVPVPASSARVDAAKLPTADLVALPGRVVDAGTGEGIPGARVELHPPRRMTLFELQEQATDRIWPFSVGRSRHAWPSPLTELSDLECAGRESFDVYTAPAPGDAPIAITTTNERGEFEMKCSSALGFVVCRAQGYSDARVPVKPYEIHRENGPSGNAVEKRVDFTSVEIRMSASRRFFGELIDAKGERVRRVVKLAFDGQWKSNGKYGSNIADTWTASTDAEGHFDVQIAADSVQVRSLEPDFLIGHEGLHPVTHERWAFQSSFAPGTQEEAALLVLIPAPSLVVRDRETKRPIERFSVKSSGEMRAWVGSCFARGGRLALLADAVSRGSVYDAMRKRHVFTVWAPGYAAATVAVADLLDAGEIGFELERGEWPAVRGRVHENSKPALGATACLVSTYEGFYYPDHYDVVDAVRCGADGEFELHVPDGDYGLRIARGTDVEWRAIHVPLVPPNDFVDVDFGVDTSIVVHMRDSNGKPCVRHTIALRAVGGSDARSKTDEMGVARFSRLASGAFDLFVPYKSTDNSFRPDEVIRVALQTGEQRNVDITIPAPDPRFARLVVEGESTLVGWKACERYSDRWQSIESDGRIPIDIQLSVRELTIVGPKSLGGCSWHAQIPRDPQDRFEIHIAPNGLGYAGVLTSMVDGQPLAGVHVESSKYDPSVAVRCECTSDAQGRFRLTGLAPKFGTLCFGEGFGWSDDVYLTPSAAPASPPTELSLALPRQDERSIAGLPVATLRGRVGHLSTETPTGLWITTEVELPAGKLRIGRNAKINDDGRYSVIVPVATHYSVSVFAGGSDALKRFDWDQPATTATIERDFDLP